MNSARVPGERKINPYPRRLYFIFLFLAVLSCVGLDYLTWRKGERAFLFYGLADFQKAAELKQPLEELALRSLESCGVSTASIERWQDESGAPRLHIRLPLEAYTGLAPELERQLLEQEASVAKEEKEDKEEVTFLWRVSKEKQDLLSLLFACPRPLPAEKEVIALRRPDKKRVAIIIDDLGFSLEALQQICDLKIPVTVAVLPLSPYARETAIAAHENGLEVMLHLPCESLNHQEEDNGASRLIRSQMGEEEIRLLTEDFLGRVPFIKGVNNHMGSKITQEPSIMRPILELLAERKLYFLDSRTTANSIAFDLSKRMGLPSAYRNVFLDSSVGADLTRKKLIELLKLAQKTGSAVGIGHPFPETLQALGENVHLFKEYEVEPVFASQVVR
ncbi:MAG: divergent polysaccharide deacetylase family protein [Candidatus Aminicenantes bacterium]|nr:divergent polysaccharide deacetylase family protein [Candidatus Aminicenantes bacterium]